MKFGLHLVMTTSVVLGALTAAKGHGRNQRKGGSRKGSQHRYPHHHRNSKESGKGHSHHRQQGAHVQAESVEGCTLDVAKLLTSKEYQYSPGDWIGDNHVCSNWQRSRAAASLLHASTSLSSHYRNASTMKLTLEPVCGALNAFTAASCSRLENAWNDDLLVSLVISLRHLFRD